MQEFLVHDYYGSQGAGTERGHPIGHSDRILELHEVAPERSGSIVRLDGNSASNGRPGIKPGRPFSFGQRIACTLGANRCVLTWGQME